MYTRMKWAVVVSLLLLGMAAAAVEILTNVHAAVISETQVRIYFQIPPNAIGHAVFVKPLPDGNPIRINFTGPAAEPPNNVIIDYAVLQPTSFSAALFVYPDIGEYSSATMPVMYHPINVFQEIGGCVGQLNVHWHNPACWSLGHVPTETEIARIEGNGPAIIQNVKVAGLIAATNAAKLYCRARDLEILVGSMSTSEYLDGNPTGLLTYDDALDPSAASCKIRITGTGTSPTPPSQPLTFAPSFPLHLTVIAPVSCTHFIHGNVAVRSAFHVHGHLTVDVDIGIQAPVGLGTIGAKELVIRTNTATTPAPTDPLQSLYTFGGTLHSPRLTISSSSTIHAIVVDDLPAAPAPTATADRYLLLQLPALVCDSVKMKGGALKLANHDKSIPAKANIQVLEVEDASLEHNSKGALDVHVHKELITRGRCHFLSDDINYGTLLSLRGNWIMDGTISSGASSGGFNIEIIPPTTQTGDVSTTNIYLLRNASIIGQDTYVLNFYSTSNKPFNVNILPHPSLAPSTSPLELSLALRGFDILRAGEGEGDDVTVPNVTADVALNIISARFYLAAGGSLRMGSGSFSCMTLGSTASFLETKILIAGELSGASRGCVPVSITARAKMVMSNTAAISLSGFSLHRDAVLELQGGDPTMGLVFTDEHYVLSVLLSQPNVTLHVTSITGPREVPGKPPMPVQIFVTSPYESSKIVFEMESISAPISIRLGGAGLLQLLGAPARAIEKMSLTVRSLLQVTADHGWVVFVDRDTTVKVVESFVEQARLEGKINENVTAMSTLYTPMLMGKHREGNVMEMMLASKPSVTVAAKTSSVSSAAPAVGEGEGKGDGDGAILSKDGLFDHYWMWTAEFRGNGKFLCDGVFSVGEGTSLIYTSAITFSNSSMISVAADTLLSISPFSSQVALQHAGDVTAATSFAAISPYSSFSSSSPSPPSLYPSTSSSSTTSLTSLSASSVRACTIQGDVGVSGSLSMESGVCWPGSATTLAGPGEVVCKDGITVSLKNVTPSEAWDLYLDTCVGPTPSGCRFVNMTDPSTLVKVETKAPVELLVTGCNNATAFYADSKEVSLPLGLWVDPLVGGIFGVPPKAADARVLTVIPANGRGEGEPFTIRLEVINYFCPAGSYCPTRSEVYPCPEGSFCPPNSPVFFPCANGTGRYCGPNSNSEEACPIGSVCETNTVIKACVEDGSYCPAGSMVERACLRGNECANSSVMVPCALGDYCPERTTTKRKCREGHVCAKMWTEEPCAVGFLCPEGRWYQEPCEDKGHEGDYCDGGRNYRQCSAGHFCPHINVSTVCPKGNSCPRGSYSPQKCAPGHVAGEAGMSACTPCALGYFMSEEGHAVCEECPAGTYADRLGSSRCSNCGAKYTSTSGAQSSSQCVPLPEDTFSSILKQIIISIPAVAGSIGVLLFGVWLRRRQNDRTWARFTGYGIANKLRKDLKLNIGSIKDANEQRFLQRFEILFMLVYRGVRYGSLVMRPSKMMSTSVSSERISGLSSSASSSSSSTSNSLLLPASTVRFADTINSSSNQCDVYVPPTEEELNGKRNVTLVPSSTTSADPSRASGQFAQDLLREAQQASRAAGSSRNSMRDPLLLHSKGLGKSEVDLYDHASHDDADADYHDNSEAFLLADSFTPEEQTRYAAAIGAATRMFVHFPRACGEETFPGKITFPRSYLIGVIPNPFPCISQYDFSEKHFAMKTLAIAAEAVAILVEQDNAKANATLKDKIQKDASASFSPTLSSSALPILEEEGHAFGETEDASSSAATMVSNVRAEAADADLRRQSMELYASASDIATLAHTPAHPSRGRNVSVVGTRKTNAAAGTTATLVSSTSTSRGGVGGDALNRSVSSIATAAPLSSSSSDASGLASPDFLPINDGSMAIPLVPAHNFTRTHSPSSSPR